MPDILSDHLKVLFVGYNPGMLSAATGHHYAGKSNRFWKLLWESEITPYLFKPEEDTKLLTLGYGSTNLVDRPTRSSNEITPQDYKEGSLKLARLILEVKPAVACYVGIGVYRTFASEVLKIPRSRVEVTTGLQEQHLVKNTIDYVCSNPSGLNTIPYGEQLNCFIQLKEFVSKLCVDR